MPADEIVNRYLIILIACTSLSTVASLTVVVPLLLSPNLRSRTFTLVTGYINVAGFISSVAYLLHFLDIQNIWLCKMQACFAVIFKLAAAFWMTVITHFVYRIVVVGNNREISISWKHHFFCWGAPVILAVLPLLARFDFGAYKESLKLVDEKDRVAFEILTLACAYSPTSATPSGFAEQGHLPVFFVFALWIYVCVLIMIFEVTMIFWRAHQLQIGDIRLEILKYALYPSGLILSEGIFYFFMAVASETRTLPYYIPANLFCLMFLHGFLNAVNFWVMDASARRWVYAKINQGFDCRNVHAWVLEDVDIDDDDSHDSTVRFHTNPADQDSKGSCQKSSQNEVCVSSPDNIIL